MKKYMVLISLLSSACASVNVDTSFVINQGSDWQVTLPSSTSLLNKRYAVVPRRMYIPLREKVSPGEIVKVTQESFNKEFGFKVVKISSVNGELIFYEYYSPGDLGLYEIEKYELLKKSVGGICKNEKDTIAAISGSITIGMKKECAIYSWGEPTSTNRTVNEYSVYEQLVYSLVNTYLYIENGVVKSWRNYSAG
ncbi:MAG: hypothetical protein NTV43_04135 [Methylococcales bacterium]|nr:hypothetical protein [Methylococcales bacterium]